jgi:predicted  nucleic acid-binding Zn-ribbon protein
MASPQKISELTTAGPLTGAELVPVVQNGGTLQTTVSALKTFSLGNIENEVSLLDARVEAVSALATQNATAIASIQTSLTDLNVRVANVSASVSVLNVQMVQVQASISAINSLLAAIDISVINTLIPQVSALEVRVSALSTQSSLQAGAITSINSVLNAVSARTSVNAAAITSINNVVSAVEVRVSTLSATAVQLAYDVSILGTRVDAVSVIASANTAAITSINNTVSALEVRVSSVSALTSANAAAITSTNAVIANVSSLVSALDIRVGEVSASVSALQVQVNNVSAALTSTNNVVSALEVRVSSVSAAASNASAAITSINNAVSALEIRVSAASATGAANSAAITSVNNVVSALDIRLTNVSASVSVLNVQMGQALASISAINSVLATIDTSAIAGLEVRVSNLSIAVSTNSAAITSVNAVVSLKAFRNGDFLTNVQYIGFNTTTSYAPAPGRLTWDIESGTLDLGLTGTVNLLIGQRTVAQVYNNSGVTLPKGKAVKVTGAQGQRLTGALAQADSDADSMTIFGIMLETVSVNNSGYVATDGLVRNVNTLGYSDGDIVYLSPVSAGELTPIKPVAPQHLVQIGYIVNGGSGGAGEIYVKVQNGYEIGELHNVKTSSDTSIADGEVLAWNASASVWTNSTALIATQASVSVLQLQVNAVSAALTSTNNVVSALEIRVSTVSAQASAIQTQVNAVSVLVSALDVRIAAVSASVSVINARLPSGTVVGTTDTQTLTNKRVNPRVVTTAGTGGGNITPTGDTADQFVITALTSSATFLAPSGTPVDGQKLIIRIKDNGSSYALTWTSTTAGYRAVGATIPTATSASRTTYVGCIYNSADQYWDVVAAATQV